MENMGPGSSGANYISFEYFHEMFVIFGKSPAIFPHHLEASLEEVNANVVTAEL
jgi:hypothetical protein